MKTAIAILLVLMLALWSARLALDLWALARGPARLAPATPLDAFHRSMRRWGGLRVRG